MSDIILINNLKSFLNIKARMQLIDSDNTIQATLLKQIQQHFSSIELTKFIDDAHNNL